MVVCHCLSINDRTIAHFAADAEATVDHVTAHCGAGGSCGGCRETISWLLERARSHDVTAVTEPITERPIMVHARRRSSVGSAA
jgi:bacterioferritin-associated ferredoxin